MNPCLLRLLVTPVLFLLCTGPLARAVFPEGNDTFGSGGSITENGGQSLPTQMMTYTKQAGEPGHRNGAQAGGQSAWWNWTPALSGFCTVDTEESLYYDDGVVNTVLSVYTGSSVNALTRVVSSDDSFQSISAVATFYAQAGTTYRIAVDTYTANTTGIVALRLRHLIPAAQTLGGAWSADAAPGLQGTLTLTRTVAGSLSGTLKAGGSTFPFKGSPGADGYFVAGFMLPAVPGKLPPNPLTLIVDLARSNPFFEVHDGGHRAPDRPLLVQGVFTKQAPTSLAGAYTARLTTSAATGFGYVSMTISPTGKVTGRGVMGDGQKVLFGSALIGPAGGIKVPVHAGLFGGQGYLSGLLAMTEQGAVDRAKSDFMSYRRPASTSGTFYTSGIETAAVFEGATYAKPVANQRALSFLDMTGLGKLVITAAAGEIGAVTENLTLSTANKFVFTTPQTRLPSLKLNKATGLVTGAITEPAGTRRKLAGILFRNPNNANAPTLSGFVTGSTRTAQFNVTP